MKIHRLKLRALDACLKRCHKMAAWEWNTSYCEECGLWVQVDPNPPANGIAIGGPAVAVDCVHRPAEGYVKCACGRIMTPVEAEGRDECPSCARAAHNRMRKLALKEGFAPCSSCGTEMNPVEVMMSYPGTICGECTRKAHKRLTG